MTIPTMLRGEVWRVTHHRISRAFTAALLITVVGLMAFQAFTHSVDVDAALRQAETERDQVGSSELFTGEQDFPISAFYQEPRYFWAFNARTDIQSTAVIATVFAFMWGIILSGSGWTTGTNRHVFTWEPRRAQLLTTRAFAVATAATVAYLVAIAITLGGSLAIAATRGSFASVSSDLVLSTLAGVLRGGMAVAALAAAGSALADLVRSPIPPLVTMAGYLVLAEPAVRATYPGAADRLATSLLIEWIRGRFLEGRTELIDCGVTPCPEALYFATPPGPGFAIVGFAVLVLAAMWLTIERRDVTT